MQNKTKIIALTATYAALYTVLIYVFQGISFGPIQLRIANSLLATIPLFGLAGALGQPLGVCMGNAVFGSDLGLIDTLNAVPSLIMAFVIYYTYKKTKNDYTVIATCLAYSVVLGATVGWMINYTFVEAPLILTIATVTTGNIVASVLIGWPLFKLLKKTGIRQWIEIETKNEEKIKNE